MSLKEQRDRAERMVVGYTASLVQAESLAKRIKVASINCLNWERAEQVITSAAKATHDDIALNLSSICSEAVNEVMGKSCYEISIFTKEKRNNIELAIDLIKNGKSEGNPVDANGGGICDILSVTLLFVCWKLSGNRSRDLFILDEPFKNLDSERQENACAFFQDLANSLGLKVLMITHIPNFVEIAEHTIKVTRKKGASHVSCL
jgi:ABC-type enterochelin transport system ATPase subunit